VAGQHPIQFYLRTGFSLTRQGFPMEIWTAKNQKYDQKDEQIHDTMVKEVGIDTI
jgi:hypothetical protein